MFVFFLELPQRSGFRPVLSESERPHPLTQVSAKLTLKPNNFYFLLSKLTTFKVPKNKAVNYQTKRRNPTKSHTKPHPNRHFVL